MTERRSLIGPVIILLAFTAAVLAYDGWVSPGSSPVAWFHAQVPDAARAQFMAKIVEFSNTGLFSTKIRPLFADGKHFFAELDRRDVMIEIMNPVYPPSDFQIWFYESGVRPADRAEIAQLAQRLRSELGDVTGSPSSNVRELGRAQY